MYPTMKVRESVGRHCEAYGETSEIHNPNKHMGFDKLKLEGFSNGLSHWGETPMTGFFTLGVVGVRESVGTWVVDMRSLISCMTRNIPYRITLFIWNMV